MVPDALPARAAAGGCQGEISLPVSFDLRAQTQGRGGWGERKQERSVRASHV